jgi:hypothetical protein
MSNRLPPLLPDYSEAFMYMLTMPTNMIASFLFGYATIGLFLSKKKERVRTIGLMGVILAILAGFPLAIYSMFFGGQGPSFSMFIMGPVVSLLVGLIFLSTKMWSKIIR